MAIVNLAWPLFMLAGALMMFVMVFLAIRKWPIFGLLLAGIQVIFLMEVPNSFNLVTAGGVHIAFLDVYSVALLFISFSGRQDGIPNPVLRFFIAFAVTVAVSVLIGIEIYGPNVATNESRQFIWMVACLLWSASLDWASVEFRRKVLRLLVGLGCALVVAAGIHARLRGFGAYGDDFIDPTGDRIERRILSSGQALVLTFGMLAAFALAKAGKHPRWLVLTAGTFGVVILLSQQRTVWVVATVALVLAFLLDRQRRASEYALGIAVSIAILVIFASGLLDGLLATLSGSITNTKTLDSRADGWLALVRQNADSGPIAVVFGQPFGAGYRRVEMGHSVSFSPHNWYVNVFLRTGIVGLILYCAGLACALAVMLKRKYVVISLFLICIVVYGWAYNATWYNAILIGSAVALSRKREERGPASSGAMLSSYHGRKLS